MTAPERSLSGVAVFKDLSPDARGHAESRCGWRRVGPGTMILDYQDRSSDVFFIVHGTVRAVIYSPAGKVVAFGDLGPGQMFGELAAIDAQPRSASIEAVEPCLIAQMSPTVFWDLVVSEPPMTKAVLLHLNGLVRSLSNRVYEFSTLAVQNRIQAELVRIARKGQVVGGKIHIANPPKHSEIASRISTHREAVTRELGRLAKLGIISRDGAALQIMDLDRLARMVRQATQE